jgi:hypothetical protein
MPCKRDPVWAQFTEIKEQYKEEPAGETKALIKCKLGKRKHSPWRPTTGEFASKSICFQPAYTQKYLTFMFDAL